MGGEYRYDNFHSSVTSFREASSFSTASSQLISATAQTGGYSGADFLMGDIQNSIIAVALASADFRNSEWAAYVDDTWKVMPKLTITAGLRWEVAQPMIDASGNEVGVQLNSTLANIPNVPDQRPPSCLRSRGQRRLLPGTQLPLPGLLGRTGRQCSRSAPVTGCPGWPDGFTADQYQL